MRHRVGGRKLGLPSDQRRALLRSLVSAVLWEDEIHTTEARAKEAARIVERVITLAKRNDLHSRRLVQKMIFEQNIPFQGSSDKSHRDNRNPHRLMRRIFQDIGPLYRDVRGGYVRITRIGPRRGDAAMMVRLELTKGISLSSHRSGSRRSTRTADAPARTPAAVTAGGSAPAEEPAAAPTETAVPVAAAADTPVTTTVEPVGVGAAQAETGGATPQEGTAGNE